MRRPEEFIKDLEKFETIIGLTDVFKGIAGIHIAQIKNHVLHSKGFFAELWNLYLQIRVDSDYLFENAINRQAANPIDKDLIIVITAEGGFSGDVDQKLINWMLKQYDELTDDIIVIGHHGAVQLAQAGVAMKRYYKLPTKDHNINVSPIINDLQKYRKTTVYYQTYVSLMVQDIKKIDLQTAVKNLSAQTKEDSATIITTENYLFEPSAEEVISYLEKSMLHIALAQVILESKLSQYASRFRSMSLATDRGLAMKHETDRTFRHVKRSAQDERLKEITAAVRKVANAKT